MNKFPIQIVAAVYRVTELFPQNEPIRYKIREIAIEILADFAMFQNLESQGAETESNRNRVKNQIFSKIEILNNYYFDLAREQNWVNPSNFLILKREYDKMKSNILETEQGPALHGFDEPEQIIEPEPEPTSPDEALAEAGPAIEPIKPEINDKLSVINGEPERAAKPEPEPEPEPAFAKGFGAAKQKLSPRHKEILKIIEQGSKKQVGEIRKSFPNLSKRTLRRDLEALTNQGYVERLGKWNEVSYQIKP